MQKPLPWLGLLIAAGVALPASAEPSLSGRWLGSIELPGRRLDLVVDLDRDASDHWQGSITVPGLELAGAELGSIHVSGPRMEFTIPSALGDPATFAATRRSATALEGSLSFAGHKAPFQLHRSGPAQVERPPVSTAVEPEFIGTWRGDYQLSGYAHHVTLTMANSPGGIAIVGFELVGKQPHALKVDLVTNQEGLLRVESRELAVNFEGRVDAATGELRGTVEQGSLEAPIVLVRSVRGSP